MGSWKQEAGQGLEGMIDGQHIHIGRPSWLRSMGMQIDHLLPSQDSYGSQVMLALDGTPTLIGNLLIAFAKMPRR